MKNILIVCLALLLTAVSYGQDKEGQEIVRKYRECIEEKRWKDAEVLIENLITKYPHSVYRENYYYGYFQVVFEEIHEYDVKFAKENPADTSSNLRGTITVDLGHPLTPAEIELHKKILKKGHEYLESYPSGQYSVKVRSYMLTAYRKLGEMDLAINFASELLREKDPLGICNGAWFLAMLSHFRRQYREAIPYHELIVKNTPDADERIKHQYYIAICNYENGEYNIAKEQLSVLINNDDGQGRGILKLAAFVLDYLDETNHEMRRNFVIVKGLNQ
ncbi:hypothetical protein KAR48_16105 [bacterium]|nr:hypothetical protein [bacterium]